LKTFTVPLIDMPVHVYVGPSEWGRWLRDCTAEGMDGDLDCPEGGGRTFASRVWIVDASEDELIYHELSHAVDNLLHLIGTRDGEFRAYITGWLMSAVAGWAL
jgi:hypothetical protein